MSRFGLSGRSLSVFAATALFVPPTTVLANIHGWPMGTAGTALAAMTVTGVLTAPLWGLIDDRCTSRGLPLAALLSAAASFMLFLEALSSFEPLIVIPSLSLLGACSGALDSMVSARIQRSGHAHSIASIRSFGAVGWGLGLVIASLLTLWGWLPAVYAFASAFLLLLAFIELCNATPPTPTEPLQGIALPVAFFVVIGLPIPVASYSYLLYSTSTLDAIGQILPAFPFTTLLILAALEIPIFVTIAPHLQGRRVWLLYASSLLLLAISWIPLAAGAPNTIAIAALVPFTLSTVVWSVAQPAMVRAYTPHTHAGVAQSTVASLTKCLSAIIAGAVVGSLSTGEGVFSAPSILLIISVVGSFVMFVAAAASPSLRSAVIPHRQNNKNRKLDVYSH